MLDMTDKPLMIGDKVIYVAHDGDRRFGHVVGFTLKMVKINAGYSKDILHPRQMTVDPNNLVKI